MILIFFMPRDIRMKALYLFNKDNTIIIIHFTMCIVVLLNLNQNLYCTYTLFVFLSVFGCLDYYYICFLLKRLSRKK